MTALAGAAMAATPDASQTCRPEPTTITVDAGRVLGPLPKFWRCTGFTPAELLLLPEMRQTLSFLGAVPNRGLEFVRVHYLLDLIVAKRTGATIAYDWALFDEALAAIVERGLRPFFELMGNPSNLFDDFSDMEQVRAWRDLVAELASRCIARYGRDEVRAWWFETWNEPDLPFWGSLTASTPAVRGSTPSTPRFASAGRARPSPCPRCSGASSPIATRG
jgi:L-iduronidase